MHIATFMVFGKVLLKSSRVNIDGPSGGSLCQKREPSFYILSLMLNVRLQFFISMNRKYTEQQGRFHSINNYFDIVEIETKI